MNYTAIIVDDEPEHREGLIQLIPWASLGINTVLEAMNGLEALELIKTHNPSVLFTDLIMPVLNGIELIRKLNEMEHPVKTIVISGYDEFHYVREVMRLGAVDYILKPFRSQEILPIAMRCMEDLRLSQLEVMKRRNEQEKYEAALVLLQDKLLKEIASGYMNKKEKINQTLKQLNLNWMTESTLIVLTLEIDNTRPHHTLEIHDPRIFAIGNVVRESCLTQAAYHLHYSGNGRWVLIIRSDTRSNIECFAQKLLSNVTQFTKLSVTIGIGITCKAEKLSESYFASIEALEFKTILGGRQVLFYEEVRLYPERYQLNISPIEQEMMAVLKTGVVLDQKEFRPRLIQLIESWGTYKREQVHQHLFEWLLKIERHLKLYHEKLDVIGNNTLNYWNKLSSYDTREGITNYCLELLGEITTQICREQEAHLGQITSRALHLIKERFATSGFTLATLAEMVFVSPVWLSHLLKKETGRTFLELVTEQRIETAKALLQNLSLKVYEIAEQVGYRDIDYFSKQFKKHTSMTPGEYRNHI